MKLFNNKIKLNICNSVIKIIYPAAFFNPPHFTLNYNRSKRVQNLWHKIGFFRVFNRLIKNVLKNKRKKEEGGMKDYP